MPWARRLLQAPIRAYQRWISPWKPPTCRFAPTCSCYAYEALGRHGVWRGGVLAVRRILRCHPWHPGGWDPVPPRLGGPDAELRSDGAGATSLERTAQNAEHPRGPA